MHLPRKLALGLLILSGCLGAPGPEPTDDPEDLPSQANRDVALYGVQLARFWAGQPGQPAFELTPRIYPETDWGETKFTDGYLNSSLTAGLTPAEVRERIGPPRCGAETRLGLVITVHHYPYVLVYYEKGILSKWSRIRSFEFVHHPGPDRSLEP